MNLNLKVFVFAVIACLLMSFDGTKAWSQSVHKGAVLIPMSEPGFRPHSPSEDGIDMICYLSDGMLYVEIEDFSGMIYVELQTLDGGCVHREYYYYTNPYTISTSSLHGDYVVKIKIDDATYQGYFNI